MLYCFVALLSFIKEIKRSPTPHLISIKELKMKIYRWFTSLLLVGALCLGGCTTQSGANAPAETPLAQLPLPRLAQQQISSALFPG
jgi:hypothetical protein